MRTLYFDCFAGASGNMILAALIAAGVDRELLAEELRKLNIPDFELRMETVDRSGIASQHLEVIVPDEKNHRHLHHIEEIINGSSLSDPIKERSLRIFRRLAEAEAKVHGIEFEKVHFHEVGALDAVIDIVGSCIGFEILGIEGFACSKIHVGSGFVEMEHGKFPVPPPAVAELLKGIPVYSTEIEGELMTPTGAAIISTVCDTYGKLPEMSVEVTAYGAGTRRYKSFPNVLRIFIGETTDTDSEQSFPNGRDGNRHSLKPRDDTKLRTANYEHLILLETNIDDMSPQIIGYVMENAFNMGALDCWFTPVQMKKNRPAVIISILCSPADEAKMLELLYAETTTIGVRVSEVRRDKLERSITTVATEFGDVRIKVATRDGAVVNSMPEYEDVRRIAFEKNVAFRIVWDAAMNASKALSRAAAK